MCELCDLNNSKDGFIVTHCKTCGDILVVLREHREGFTEKEIAEISSLFPHKPIRWKEREIFDHAHCHIIERR